MALALVNRGVKALKNHFSAFQISISHNQVEALMNNRPQLTKTWPFSSSSINTQYLHWLNKSGQDNFNTRRPLLWPLLRASDGK